MARQIITGKSGLIEVRPKTTGVVYPAESGAWFKLAEVSTDAKLEITGETVFCYSGEPAQVMHELEARPGLRYLHRPANLEDVFLKLTGRELRD